MQQYQCDICHTVYSDESACKFCESSHKIPVKIVGYKFNSIKNNGQYPKTIIIEFADVTTKTLRHE